MPQSPTGLQHGTLVRIRLLIPKRETCSMCHKISSICCLTPSVLQIHFSQSTKNIHLFRVIDAILCLLPAYTQMLLILLINVIWQGVFFLNQGSSVTVVIIVFSPQAGKQQFLKVKKESYSTGRSKEQRQVRL